MGISLKVFIGKYLSKEDIQDSLDAIGEKVGGNVRELESRLASEWPKYRDVYDLLDYVDEDDLLEICEHFSIETKATTHNALKKRIKQSGIITGYSKKSTSSKKSKKSYSVQMNEHTKIESHISVTHIIRSKPGKIGIISLAAGIIFF